MISDGRLTAGIDIGSTSAQAVIMRGEDIVAFSNIPVGVDRRLTVERVYDDALHGAGLTRGDVAAVVGTGYGRYQVPFADRNVTEITCHARGAVYYAAGVRTVLDMGGQDCKAISCDENGRVLNFAMNDKCAAGTGRSMEVIGKLLNVPLADIGPLSLDIGGEPPQLGSTCTVFARSQALRMIRGGVPRNEVLAAYCEALVQRILSLLERVGVREELMISGGIARNTGITRRIEQRLGVRAAIAAEPQLVGAAGAALIARKHIPGGGVS